MVRRFTYCMAVVALVINALTPKASIPKTFIPVTASGQTVLQLRSHSDDARVSIPQSRHQLRRSSRAFSCPPVPLEIDRHVLTLDLPSVEIVAANFTNDFIREVTIKEPANILHVQCRLNI